MRYIILILTIIFAKSININTTNHAESFKKEAIREYILCKDSISFYPLEEILVAVANHEVYEGSHELEFRLVMEALYNRVVYNFNGNGNTITQQLLAPKQFSGLFLYHTKDFYFSSGEPWKLEIARSVISGVRYFKDPIFYWASPEDIQNRTAHGLWIKNRCMTLPKKIKNKFA